MPKMSGHFLVNAVNKNIVCMRKGTGVKGAVIYSLTVTENCKKMKLNCCPFCASTVSNERCNCTNDSKLF